MPIEVGHNINPALSAELSFKTGKAKYRQWRNQQERQADQQMLNNAFRTSQEMRAIRQPYQQAELQAWGNQQRANIELNSAKAKMDWMSSPEYITQKIQAEVAAMEGVKKAATEGMQRGLDAIVPNIQEGEPYTVNGQQRRGTNPEGQLTGKDAQRAIDREAARWSSLDKHSSFRPEQRAQVRQINPQIAAMFTRDANGNEVMVGQPFETQQEVLRKEALKASERAHQSAINGWTSSYTGTISKGVLAIQEQAASEEWSPEKLRVATEAFTEKVDAIFARSRPRLRDFVEDYKASQRPLPARDQYGRLPIPQPGAGPAGTGPAGPAAPDPYFGRSRKQFDRGAPAAQQAAQQPGGGGQRVIPEPTKSERGARANTHLQEASAISSDHAVQLSAAVTEAYGGDEAKAAPLVGALDTYKHVSDMTTTIANYHKFISRNLGAGKSLQIGTMSLGVAKDRLISLQKKMTEESKRIGKALREPGADQEKILDSMGRRYAHWQEDYQVAMLPLKPAVEKAFRGGAIQMSPEEKSIARDILAPAFGIGAKPGQRPPKSGGPVRFSENGDAVSTLVSRIFGGASDTFDHSATAPQTQSPYAARVDDFYADHMAPSTRGKLDERRRREALGLPPETEQGKDWWGNTVQVPARGSSFMSDFSRVFNPWEEHNVYGTVRDAVTGTSDAHKRAGQRGREYRGQR